jgi:hypothetical protein
MGAGPNTLTFTPSGDYTYDSFDIWYMRDVGFGIFHANIDGGGDTVINTAGVAAIVKTTIASSASPSHVVQFGSVTGNVLILGIEPSLSTTPRLRIGNAGVSGTTTTEWTTAAAGPGIGPLDAIRAYAADTWIISLGINDAVNDIPLTTTLANLATIIAACQGSASDIVLCSGVPSSPAAVGPYVPIAEVVYTAALQAFCVSNGYGFVDIFNRWGGLNGYSELQPLGYYYDVYHPSGSVGYPDIAKAEFSSMINL